MLLILKMLQLHVLLIIYPMPNCYVKAKHEAELLYVYCVIICYKCVVEIC